MHPLWRKKAMRWKAPVLRQSRYSFDEADNVTDE